MVDELPECAESVLDLLAIPVEAVGLDLLPALLADGGQQDGLEEPRRGDGVGRSDAHRRRPLGLQGVEVGEELGEGVALARLGDTGPLEDVAVVHEDVRAVHRQGGRVLLPVDRDRGEDVLGELGLDVVGEQGGDVADGAGVVPGGDVPAHEALPDVGRVPARDARGQGDVGLGAPAADDRDLVDGGLGVALLVLVDEGVEGGGLGGGCPPRQDVDGPVRRVVRRAGGQGEGGCRGGEERDEALSQSGHHWAFLSDEVVAITRGVGVRRS